MEKHERIERNPLRHIQKVQSNGEQTRPRRAFTREEFQRLLAVSQSRKPVYLTAVFTGLRRNELASLEWDDVHLNAAQPFFNVRASTTKNHKQAVISLHEDVVTELRKLQAKRHSSANGLVFAALMPNMETFKADLKEANIEFINAKNQRADFHSLRHTLATNLALAGTAPRVAMEIMRHCDMRLTSKTYTDTGLLPITDAVAKLPSFIDSSVKNSQIDSQSLIRMGQVLSVPVEKITNRDELKTVDKQGFMNLQSTSGTTRQEREECCAIQVINQHRLRGCWAETLCATLAMILWQ
jgi:hypothetical protein